LHDLGAEAEFAARLMADAAQLAQTIAVAAEGTRTKADESPVTLVDFSVQAMAAYRLSRQFPALPIVAEEDAEALRHPAADAILARVTDEVRRVEPGLDRAAILEAIDLGTADPGPRFWTLDPIDGTKGLLRGGQYVVALALIVEGEVEVGAIGCPRLAMPPGGGRPGGVAIAARGRGSWWQSFDGGELTPLRVSAVEDAAGARIAHSVEASHSDRGALDDVRTMMGCRTPLVLMDSQAKHVAVAAGEADVLVRFPRTGYHEAIWDIAAGHRLIEDAGGRVTDLAGAPLAFTTGRRLTGNRGLVASNGRLHTAVLEAIAARLPRSG
jgi:3'(2'), 5'-bisphosphate nucleotidase